MISLLVPCLLTRLMLLYCLANSVLFLYRTITSSTSTTEPRCDSFFITISINRKSKVHPTLLLKAVE